MKKQDWIDGSFIQIPLGDGYYSLARLLKSPNVTFYNEIYHDEEKPSFQQNVPAFIICIYTDIIKKGEWRIIKVQNLETEFKFIPKYFKQDPITKKYSIYQGGIETPCSKDDCIGLERLSIWDSRHIVDRINDMRAGNPNKWVESMKL